MPAMGFLGKLFFRGLAAILPLALTGWLIWAAVYAGETFLRSVIEWVFEQIDVEYTYQPGMGFAFSIVLVLIVGLLMYSFLVRTVYRKLTSTLSRIPVVKSVYGMIVDVVRLFGGEERPLQQVVLVQLDGVGDVIGFLTREDFDDLKGFPEGRVAVYLPMSYQLGGYTVLVERSRVTKIDMKAEDALRFCVTAGVARPDNV